MAGKIFVFILMILAIQSCGDIDKQSDDALGNIIDFPEYIDSLNLDGQDFNVHRMLAARIGVKLIDTFDFGNQQLDLNCVHFYDEYDFEHMGYLRIRMLTDSSITLFVDTSFKIASGRRWYGLHQKRAEIELAKAKNGTSLDKRKQGDETIEFYNYYPVFIINNLDSSLTFDYQHSSKLKVIQEAQDTNGIWRPIEFWKPNWCGNTYSTLWLKPNHYIMSQVKVYRGEFKTKMRLKLSIQNRYYYSKPYVGSVNYSQFDVPEKFKGIYGEDKLFL